LLGTALRTWWADPPHSEDVPPFGEDAGQVVADIQIGLDDLAREGSEAAAVLERATGDDEEVRPLLVRLDRVEAGEPFASVEAEHALGLPVDDGAHQALLVREVVTQLRAADSRCSSHQLVVRRVDPLRVDQVRGVLEDATWRRQPLARAPAKITRSIVHLHVTTTYPTDWA
jgi:hypothetical protein